MFCNFAGMFAGCMCFGSIADRFGRRSIFIFSLVWYSVCTAIMAFQNTAAGIDIWRFIAGIGIGLEQVTIDTFLPEFISPKGRGRAFAFYQFIEFCVVPLVALLGWLLVPKHPFGLDGWRWVTLIGSVGALAAWWLRRGLPESPRWLAEHGREAEAEQIVSALEASVSRDLADKGARPLPPPGPPIATISGTSRFREILQPPYGKRTLVLSIFNLMQTIAFYGFGSWVPTLLIAKGIQITTSLQYAFIIAIARIPWARSSECWLPTASGSENGRSYPPSVGIGVFMFLFARQVNPAVVILFGVMVTLSNNWMSFAFHNYQAELFPTRVRARAVGFVYSWSRVSAAFAGLLIGFFRSEGGAPAGALFSGAAMVVMTADHRRIRPANAALGAGRDFKVRLLPYVKRALHS